MKRILVVDDDEDLLTAMKLFFRKNGYDVAVASSGDQATSSLDTFKPDLIFMDIYLGAEDGGQMCRTIKAQAEYKDIPVVMISGNHNTLKLYEDYGADSSLKKPFHLSMLLHVVDAHLKPFSTGK